MRSVPKVVLFAVLAAALSACNLVYKLPTRQGNVLDQKQIDQLKLGMTRQQVTYLMGTPVAQSPFDESRWDYVGYYKPPRGKTNARKVTLYFDNDTLARMEGTEAPLVAGKNGEVLPDPKSIYRQQKKDENDATRGPDAPPSGVILSQPTPTP